MALLSFLASCGNGNSGKNGASSNKLQDIEWSETDIAAMAFLGYNTNYEAFKESNSFKIYSDICPVSEIQHIETDGNVWFLVIPRDTAAIVTVYEYTEEMFIMGANAENGNILYKDETGKPFLLKCNISDAMPNTSVTITDANGGKLEFSPQIGMNDGMVSLPADGTLKDISLYEKLYGFVPDGDHVEQTLTVEEENITAVLRNGRVFLLIDNDKANEFCNNRLQRDCYIGDNPHLIDGVEGVCQKIFISDIGQDTNPVLCMLMDDGKVEILDIFNAIMNNDFFSSGRLPDIENITSFRAGNVSDEDGGGYVTIFAKDNAGKEHEINMFNMNIQMYRYETTNNGTVRYYIYLSPDWKIRYNKGIEYSDVFEDNYTGRFRGASWLDDNVPSEFNYEMLKSYVLPDNAMTDELLVKKDVCLKGKFSLSETWTDSGNEYTVKSLSGKPDFGSINGRGVKYGNNDNSNTND